MTPYEKLILGCSSRNVSGGGDRTSKLAPKLFSNHQIYYSCLKKVRKVTLFVNDPSAFIFLLLFILCGKKILTFMQHKFLWNEKSPKKNRKEEDTKFIDPLNANVEYSITLEKNLCHSEAPLGMIKSHLF